MGAPGLISQFSGRKIRFTYHGDHLRPFHKREGSLLTGETFVSHRSFGLNWRKRRRPGRKVGVKEVSTVELGGRYHMYIAWVIRDSTSAENCLRSRGYINQTSHH